jgi:hypothetical protein
MMKSPSKGHLLTLRSRSFPHIYPGLSADPTALKFLALMFEKVTITELSPAEIDHLHGCIEDPDSDPKDGAIKRRVRALLNKAARFQQETDVLRTEGVLEPMQWEGGLASLFQPASLSIGGQLLFLGESEINDLAQEIEDSLSEGLDLFSTPYGLTCLRENYYGDIAANTLAKAVAVAEMVGIVELFQMIPITSDKRWMNAFMVAQSARDSRDSSDETRAAALGMAVLNQLLPRIELRTFEEVLEARYHLRDELDAFRHYLREQAKALRVSPPDVKEPSIKRRAREIARSVEQIEAKISGSRIRLLKGIGLNLLTASPPTLLGYFVPALNPLIGSAVGTLLAGWGIYDAVLDYKDTSRGFPKDRSGLSFLVKVRRRL